MTIHELEKTLSEISPDTLVLCLFYGISGEIVSERLIRFGECAETAKKIAMCRSWQPFLAMHAARRTVID